MFFLYFSVWFVNSMGWQFHFQPNTVNYFKLAEFLFDYNYTLRVLQAAEGTFTALLPLSNHIETICIFTAS